MMLADIGRALSSASPLQNSPIASQGIPARLLRALLGGGASGVLQKPVKKLVEGALDQ